MRSRRLSALPPRRRSEWLPSRLSALLLTLALLFSAAPVRPARADAVPLRIVEVSVLNDSGRRVADLTPDTLGDADRLIGHITVLTDRLVDGTTVAPSVTVTDHTGQVLSGWYATATPYIKNGFWITPPGPLPMGETYTIRIKGGSAGLKAGDGSGAVLAFDHVVSFRTVSLPLQMLHGEAHGNDIAFDLTDGATLRRTTTSLELSFDHLLAAGSAAGNVTVSDSQGRTDLWRVESVNGQTLLVRASAYLPKNETYTLRIRGGADGLKSESGVTLAADVVMTLHTDDQSWQVRRLLRSPAAAASVRQTELYRITASAGPLTIAVSDWVSGQDPSLEVHLEDPQTPEVLLDKRLSAYGTHSATVTLPRDGVYYLGVGPTLAGSVELTGQDLFVSSAMPVVEVPTVTRPFTVQDRPFYLTPAVRNPAETESLVLKLNDKVLRENALAPGGTVDPLVIDPGALTDGIYTFTASAKPKWAANVAITQRTFLVDRVSSFTDVPATHWARPYVEVMHHLGILNGRGKGAFEPGAPVTRAEFAKMMALSLGLKPSGQSPAPFVDVANDWSTPHITALAEHGLIKGDVVGGRSYFYPNRTITRAEAATMVGRVLGVAGQDMSGAPQRFVDSAEIPAWAESSVVILAYVGWIDGFPDGHFLPGYQLNRDQAAKLLGNFVGLADLSK